jgi:hypothetical protein
MFLAAVSLVQPSSLKGKRSGGGGGAVIGLCALLAILGRVEHRQGLENLRIANGLRLDRL